MFNKGEYMEEIKNDKIEEIKQLARPANDLFKEMREEDEARKELWGRCYFIYESFWWTRWFILNLPYHLKFIKWGWQRAMRGWSDRDTWSFDYHIANVIEGGVNHLLKNQHGHPGEFNNIFEWEDVMKEIAWTFRIHKLLIDSDDGYYLLYDENHKMTDSQFIMLTKEQTERYYKGFDLLKKYIMNLGD